MKKVYIASPYTRGDVAVNVKFQIDIASELINLGYAPFVPLLSHFQHLVHPEPYEVWTTLDLEWVKSCDCVLRLGGVSLGADKETWFAEKYDIPVFYNITDLERFYNN